MKNLHFRVVVLEKTLKISLDSKEIKPVSSKGNQPWIFTGRIDAEVETLILWSPDVKIRLTGKDSDVGNDWGQEKGVTENEMVGWHPWLDGHEFEQTLGDTEGQGSLAMLQFMGSQRVWHDLAAEQQQQKPVRKLLNYKHKNAQDLKPSYLMSALTMKPLSQTCTPLFWTTFSSTTTVFTPQTHQLKSKPNHFEDDSKNDRGGHKLWWINTNDSREQVYRYNSSFASSSKELQGTYPRHLHLSLFLWIYV